MIKALTLFFIDSVDKVRDNNASDGRGEYLRIFDEKYEKALKIYGKAILSICII